MRTTIEVLNPKAATIRDLAAAGVKTVINLASDDAEANEKTMVEGAPMHYVQIPMTTHEPPSAAQVTEFLTIVNDPASRCTSIASAGVTARA